MGDLNSTGLSEAGVRGEISRERSPAQPKSRWWIWVLLIALAVGGYWYFRGRSSQAQDAQGAAQGGSSKGGGKGGFGNAVVPVVVATAQQGDLPVYYTGLGTVTAFNTVTVRTRVDGQIVKVNFTEGQFVHEGDSLVEIDPRPYQVQLEQAEGQLAKDQAQLRDVQVDYDRYQLLYKEGVIPKQQVDTQQAQVGQYQGAIKADQATIDSAKLQLVYCHVTAPISGRVGLRLVDIGNIVHASDTTGLLVITQLQPISILFSLPQDQLPQVVQKLHSGPTLSVEAWSPNDTAKIAEGKLLTIDNQIDTTTGTYKLKSVFSNENNNLFPNQFVNIHLLVDTKRNLVIFPTPALQRGPQGTYVYVVTNAPASANPQGAPSGGADSSQSANPASGGSGGAGANAKIVKIHPVTVVQATGNSVGVSSGLSAGDIVVIDGQDKLQDGSRVAANFSGAGSGAQDANTQTPSQKPSSPATTKPSSQHAGKTR